MFKKIMVPYDGSKWAEAALDVAIDMAQKYGSEIVLVTFQAVPVITVKIALDREDICNEAKKEQDGAREKMDKAGIPYSSIVQCLDPAEGILRVSKEQNIDLIVMGSRGLSGLTELFLGSVSTKVVQLSKIPVLVCKK